MQSVQNERHVSKCIYRIRDRTGRVAAEHVREDYPDGEKEVRWRRPDGKWGLNGTPLERLPLYGSEQVDGWRDDDPIVLVEGEKARDALDETDYFNVLGTVTGAGKTPGPDALEVLRGREVILWPDDDEPGYKHMGAVAEALDGISAEVRWYEWREGPDDVKGADAADHPAILSGNTNAVDRLLTDLLSAPRWTPPKPANPLLQSRVLLGEGIERGFEDPEELESGILLKGRVHQIFSGAGMGKSFIALWLVKECLARGQRVVYVDMENGKRIVSDRLRAMGVDGTEADYLLTYLSSPRLTLRPEDTGGFESLMDEIRPDLIVFDSWVNFLASAGLEENSNDDIARWAVSYTHPARNRGISVVLLDHVPHEGNRSRGASRKKDEVDVQWRLANPKPFDRDTVGEVHLIREKDRESWLPMAVKFSIGGSPGGFVCERSAGTVEEAADDGFTPSMRKALNILKAVFGNEGATFGEWFKAMGESEMARSTFGLAKQKLETAGEIVQDEDSRYRHKREPRVESNWTIGLSPDDHAGEESNEESNSSEAVSENDEESPANRESNSPIGLRLDSLDSTGEEQSSPVHPPHRGGLDGLPVGLRDDEEFGGVA